MTLFLPLLLTLGTLQELPYAKEIAEFKRQDAAVPPSKGQIVFIGSSSFTNWAKVGDAFPGRKILNRAFGGSRLLDVTARLDDVVFTYEPAQVVLYCGENDFASEESLEPSVVVGRFKDLYAKVRKRLPKSGFVYVSMKPSPSRWHLAPKFREANRSIQLFLGKQGHTAFVDVWPAMLGADGKPKKEIFVEDQLHMNDQGYKLWMPLLDKVLIGSKNAPEIRFDKTVLDTRFVSEGVALGDVNRDGKLDVIAGNVWYEAPAWKPHEIAPFQFVDSKRAWSQCFHTWAADLNKDGWVDQILIGMPGEKATWRENPKGAKVHWKEHLIWRSAGNESPLYTDLLGNGKNVLVMAYDDAHLAWFEPAADPYAEWICHNVSELKGAGSQRYSHGLGVEDINGDGRNEIITTGGYYVAPKDPRKDVWTFVKSDLGPDCAHMLVLDVNADKKPDLLSTSAHARGVWWFEHLENGFKRNLIDETISVTHAAVLTQLGKAKAINLFTGKRKWGHPPGVDVGSEEPHWVVRYELRRTAAGPRWVRHVIDEDSGVGTQFVVQDVNRDGLLDIISSNKNGVFLFLQKPD